MACHIPTGGLDCRNLRDALLTLPELAVDDRFLVLVSSPLSRADKEVRGGKLAPLPFADIEDRSSLAITVVQSQEVSMASSGGNRS